jgi:hypothetical protein
MSHLPFTQLANVLRPGLRQACVGYSQNKVELQAAAATGSRAGHTSSTGNFPPAPATAPPTATLDGSCSQPQTNSNVAIEAANRRRQVFRTSTIREAI